MTLNDRLIRVSVPTYATVQYKNMFFLSEAHPPYRLATRRNKGGGCSDDYVEVDKEKTKFSTKF